MEITYQFAFADNSTDLYEMVSSMMLDGWVPQGGVSVTVDRYSKTDGEGLKATQFFYYQAMVRQGANP